jgi:5'-nucleotidase
MNLSKKNILLSNDDGIDSPGLWAAAAALSELGHVTIAAPRDHMSATGRGRQKGLDGVITKKQLEINGEMWDVFAVSGSPSQSVAHGILELSPRKPDLVVSGINFGENLGSDMTLSGTVGAAIEGASLGVPALAISQQILVESWDKYHEDVEFSISAYFTKYFAQLILNNTLPNDVHVVNVVVPANATKKTPWKVSPQASTRYFRPHIIREGKLEEEGIIGAHILDESEFSSGNDIHTVRVEKMVSVTPLSINLTSRVDITQLENFLRSE